MSPCLVALRRSWFGESVMQVVFWRLRITRFRIVTCVLATVALLKITRREWNDRQVEYAIAPERKQLEEHVVRPFNVSDIKLDLKNSPIKFPDDDGDWRPPSTSSLSRLSESRGKPEDVELQTILLWNPFFANEDYYFGLGHQPFLEKKCRVSTCRTTRNHSELDTAAVVVIHGPRVDEPLPPYRPAGQLYAYVQAEPHYNGSKTYLPTMNDMFNITMTNRRDSDVYIAYGMVLPSREAARSRADVFVSPVGRPKSVVWAVSHCNTPGRRERYVVELRKYIQVDIYGACGTLVCPKSEECMEMFTRDYKFYLALENHYCKDYVSEKLYRTLEYDIIPIVFGGADYSKDAPPHSVINILDYPHPKDLAKYLDYLSNNQTAYNEYFEWKKHYVIEHFRHVIYGGVFCRLCEILHDPDYEFRNYTNIYSWWVDGMCDPNVIGRMARKFNWFEENLRFPS